MRAAPLQIAEDFAFESGSIAIGWSSFKKKHAARCACGHARWAHMGVNDPGCSYGGVCTCAEYEKRRRS